MGWGSLMKSACLLSAELQISATIPVGKDLFFKFLLFYFYLLWLCMCVYNVWLHTCHGRVCGGLRTTSGNPSCPSTVGSRDLRGKWFLPMETFLLFWDRPLCSPGCPQIPSTPALVSHVEIIGMIYSHGQLRIRISDSPFPHSASWRFAEWRWTITKESTGSAVGGEEPAGTVQKQQEGWGFLYWVRVWEMLGHFPSSQVWDTGISVPCFWGWLWVSAILVLRRQRRENQGVEATEAYKTHLQTAGRQTTHSITTATKKTGILAGRVNSLQIRAGSISSCSTTVLFITT